MTQHGDEIHDAEEKVARLQSALDETQRALERADKADQAVAAAESSPWRFIAIASIVGLIVVILWRSKSH